MKFIDLFAGIGGFHYGIKMASSNIMRNQSGRAQKSDSKTQLGFDCVYSNEWNKYANSVYKKQFGECDSQDIRKVQASHIPDHDLLCGGFPCQSFSVAGKRGGFSDTRGTLFFEVARILKEKKPRLLLLENVKGLLSHDSGNTFKTIIATLLELGYDCQWQVLNSKNFGVPQNRERVYIVGHLRGTSRPEVFPFIRASEESPIKSFYRQPLRFLKRNQKIIKGDYGYTLDASGTWGVSDGIVVRRLTPIECERLQGFPDGWTEGFSDSQRYKMLGNAVTTKVITAIIERL